jgi:hypothetical protein
LNQKYFPTRTVLILLLVWFISFLIYGWISYKNIYIDTPPIFPISVISTRTANRFSIIPLIFFILLIIIAIKRPPKHIFGLFLICIGFIILGNLLQGGYFQGFIKPLGGWDGRDFNQPFADVIKVRNGIGFLRDYNINQWDLSIHSRTHPPFLVLFWYVLYLIGGIQFSLVGSILIVSSIFPIFYLILKSLNFKPDTAARLTILLALIPSINIYSIISWDALAAIGYILFLLGMVRIYRDGLRITNFLILLIGFMFANMMNFLAVALLAILGFIGIWMFITSSRKDLLFALGLIIVSFIVFISVWKIAFNYNHFSAFFFAGNYELGHTNMQISWMSLKGYFLSRVEGFSEISLFLSFGVMAVIFSPNFSRISVNLRSFENAVLFSALTVVLLFLFFGLFRTGETARPFMWIVPIILLSLKDIEKSTLNALIGLAAIQTIAMQISANYFW